MIFGYTILQKINTILQYKYKSPYAPPLRRKRKTSGTTVHTHTRPTWPLLRMLFAILILTDDYHDAPHAALGAAHAAFP